MLPVSSLTMPFSNSLSNRVIDNTVQGTVSTVTLVAVTPRIDILPMKLNQKFVVIEMYDDINERLFCFVFVYIIHISLIVHICFQFGTNETGSDLYF